MPHSLYIVAAALLYPLPICPICCTSCSTGLKHVDTLLLTVAMVTRSNGPPLMGSLFQDPEYISAG